MANFFEDIVNQFNLAKPQQFVTPETPVIKTATALKTGTENFFKPIVDKFVAIAPKLIDIATKITAPISIAVGTGLKAIAAPIMTEEEKQQLGATPFAFQTAETLAKKIPIIGQVPGLPFLIGLGTELLVPGLGGEKKAIEEEAKALAERGISKELQPLAEEARKYKSAEDYLASKTITTNGINHLDPKEYGNFTSFVRDIEKLNDGSRPVDEIKLAEKLWGNRPRQVVENINPRDIVLAEEPLKVLPKAGRQVTEPITVEVIDGVPTLVDGRHRLAQAIANGQDTIPTKISGGSKVQKITDTYYQELLKTKNIPKELQPLVEHAQKSKTFDEFLTKFTKGEGDTWCI